MSPHREEYNRVDFNKQRLIHILRSFAKSTIPKIFRIFNDIMDFLNPNRMNKIDCLEVKPRFNVSYCPFLNCKS